MHTICQIKASSVDDMSMLTTHSKDDKEQK